MMDAPYCEKCNGTGEGQYDGAYCGSCNGSGYQSEGGPDPDEYYESRLLDQTN